MAVGGETQHLPAEITQNIARIERLLLTRLEIPDPDLVVFRQNRRGMESQRPVFGVASQVAQQARRCPVDRNQPDFAIAFGDEDVLSSRPRAAKRPSRPWKRRQTRRGPSL